MPIKTIDWNIAVRIRSLLLVALLRSAQVLLAQRLGCAGEPAVDDRFTQRSLRYDAELDQRFQAIIEKHPFLAKYLAHRGLYQLSKKLAVGLDEIKNFCVWGNHLLQ